MRKRKIDVQLALVSLAIAVGLALIGYGVLSGVTGDDVTNLPDAIESISPRPDAVQVLSQTDIVVDLADGFTGELTINGVNYETLELGGGGDADNPPDPGAQVTVAAGVRFDPGTNTLRFVPGDEVGFDEFDPGNHTVTVRYWSLTDDSIATRSYTWTFNVI